MGTDGVVERVIADSHMDKVFNGASTDDLSAGDYGIGEINQPSTTNRDDARVTAYSNIEPCLDKGDMLFVIDSKYVTGNVFNPDGASVTSRVADQNTVESGNLYTISKIYKEDPTETSFIREDRFRIVLDKILPFPGTTLSSVTGSVQYASMDNSTKTGVVNLFKFSPATTGNYDFVTQCSNRGTCDEG